MDEQSLVFKAKYFTVFCGKEGFDLLFPLALLKMILAQRQNTRWHSCSNTKNSVKSGKVQNKGIIFWSGFYNTAMVWVIKSTFNQIQIHMATMWLQQRHISDTTVRNSQRTGRRVMIVVVIMMDIWQHRACQGNHGETWEPKQNRMWVVKLRVCSEVENFRHSLLNPDLYCDPLTGFGAAPSSPSDVQIIASPAHFRPKGCHIVRKRCAWPHLELGAFVQKNSNCSGGWKQDVGLKIVGSVKKTLGPKKLWCFQVQ